MKQSGGVETVLSSQAIPLVPVIPIVMDSLMTLMLICSILTLLLIAIIWFVIRKKIWNSWNRSFWDYAKLKEKSDRYIQTSDLYFRAYPRLGYMFRGQRDVCFANPDRIQELKLASIIAGEKNI